MLVLSKNVKFNWIFPSWQFFLFGEITQFINSINKVVLMSFNQLNDWHPISLI